MFLKHSINPICAAVVILAASQALGQFEISWHTIDGGGLMFSSGANFTLGGSIGQHDASPFTPPLSGGGFELVGGFWPVALPACSCPGDMNGDNQKNGLDIIQFTHCIVVGGTCACANVDGSPGLSTNDVTVFVTDLLVGNNCP